MIMISGARGCWPWMVDGRFYATPMRRRSISANNSGSSGRGSSAVSIGRNHRALAASLITPKLRIPPLPAWSALGHAHGSKLSSASRPFPHARPHGSTGVAPSDPSLAAGTPTCSRRRRPSCSIRIRTRLQTELQRELITSVQSVFLCSAASSFELSRPRRRARATRTAISFLLVHNFVSISSQSAICKLTHS